MIVKLKIFHTILITYFIVCSQKKSRWTTIDVVVVLTAIPTLALLALLIDSSIAQEWNEDDADAVMLVLAMIAAFIGICFMVFGYATYRIGGRLWAGPMNVDHNASSNPDSLSSQCQTYEEYVIANFPPTYECVIALDQQPPPAYEATIVYIEELKDSNALSLHI